MTRYFLRRALLAVALPSVLVACGGDDDDDDPVPSPTPMVSMAEFSVTVTNTTHNQPLSPIAVVLHDGSFTPWSIGEAASAGLEDLAESGSPAAFLDGAGNALATAAGAAPVGPGANEMLTISTEEQATLYLSLATMLVNTNDAFAGAAAIAVGGLQVGDVVEYLAPVYDAGTEANDELAANIPGPAAGGEGFNSEREEHNIVTRHPGVVTQSDGYAESALDQSHRFDNGAMLIRVERTL